ncbi:hypothetical protein DL546_004860 [Coniochaeta pulveracea]|uniref:Large ribosomal subunit protein mL44 n=1 Tax=Coniochaeta pulveracea TaxID=177199 RepID=A0A420YFT5_9PEZI|nr:hypothetical protein DL546_004860 [Coniochaeta pulveracea]
MKRIRVPSQLLAARPRATPACPHRAQQLCLSQRRSQSTSSEAAFEEVEETDLDAAPIDPAELSPRYPPLDPLSKQSARYPSPLPSRSLSSAKLAALHARLYLSERVPLQTLGRALVDSTADHNPQFNNTNLAFLGHTLINYHVSEYLMVRYPRLPMTIMYSAIAAYAGPAALHQVARSWGIEAAAVPGGEVDPGLLQFNASEAPVVPTTFGSRRSEADYLEKYKWRRGINSRVIFDNDFGEVVNTKARESNNGTLQPYGTPETRETAETAYANAVRAIIGSVYAHCGREAVKSFIQAHILSRTLDLSSLFAFRTPTIELAKLCAREEFEKPVARLLSETGRKSRTPVFVVGIYSGKDKLGEGAGPSLDAARTKAAMNSLKAWYLYSPGEDVRVPSDMLVEDAPAWEPAHIDIGEVV